MHLWFPHGYGTWPMIAASAALVVLCIAAVPTNPPDGLIVGKKEGEARRPPPSPPAPVVFTDATLQFGLHFVHHQGDEHLAGIDESLAPGACAFDYDNDGWLDLFLVNGSGHTRYYGKPYWWQTSQGNALYRNLGGTGFAEVTKPAGLEATLWGMGCLSGDFDNDGDADLLVTGLGTTLIYANRGDGTFEDRTEGSGIERGLWSTASTAADYDGDGLLDLYIGNYIDFKKGTKTYEAQSQFAAEKRMSFDPSLYEPQANRLYHNLGGLRFEEVGATAGVSDIDGRTLDAAWQDLNGDGWPDLIVTNDRGTGSNIAYLNIDGRHFKPGGLDLGLQSATGSRGIAAGDIDNDGDIDLVIANPAGENTMALLNTHETAKAFNVAGLSYSDRAREIGIGASALLGVSAWTPGLHDFNNDGRIDLFLATGHLEPDPDTARVPEGQPKLLLLNRADGVFVDATASAGLPLHDTQSARGAAFADFDNDGDMDIYVAHNNDLGQLLINQSAPRHWLGLKLMGKDGNREALGAVARVSTLTGTQVRTVSSGNGFLSDGDHRLLFGLGSDTRVDGLRIRWPNGVEQTYGPVPIDGYLLIREGDEPVGISRRPESPDPRSELKLKLGVNDPSIRGRYVELIANLHGVPAVLPELRAASTDPHPAVRRAVIEVAARSETMEAVELLIRGTEDSQVTHVVAAIEGLCRYEDEITIRWLLRLFWHTDPSVKTALADCLRALFDEEEAVVHRKYLALTHLIRQLNGSAPPVRAAAARALASAERYRGLHTLVEHIHDPDPLVRAEIVRSLGLIRQRQALEPLRRLLTDHEQPAVVIAKAFIALKRLGDEHAESDLRRWVLGKDPYFIAPAATRVAVLARLFSEQEEAAAFDRNALLALSDSIFAASPPPNSHDVAALDAWLQWARLPAHDASGISTWLDQLTHEDNPEIRAAAYQSLWARKGTDAIKVAWRAMSDQDDRIRRLAQRELLQSPAKLSLSDYRPWLVNLEAQYSAGESQFDSAPLAGSRLHSTALPLAASVSGRDSAEREWLQRGCTNANTAAQDLCIAMLLAQPTPERCALASAWLLDIKAPIRLRSEILSRYGTDFDSDAVNILFALSRAKNDPLRRMAIHKLFSSDSDALLEFARKLADDPSEDAELRFDAIAFLMNRGHPEARAALYR